MLFLQRVSYCLANVPNMVHIQELPYTRPFQTAQQTCFDSSRASYRIYYYEGLTYIIHVTSIHKPYGAYVLMVHLFFI